MLRAWVGLVVCGFVLVAYAQAPPPDAASILKAATTAMGADNLKTVQFSGTGWDGCLGQAWNVMDGRWARWELKDYARTIDYEAGTSRHTAQQRAGMDPQAVGGCGAVPGAAPRAQQSNITSTSPWAQQLQIVLTPYGFIRLARDNNPVAEAQTVGGRRVNVVTFSTTRGNETYRVRGYFAADNTVEKVETWLDDPIFGDMLVEAEFSNYRNFEGLRFPARIYHKQGGLGILELNIDKVAVNPAADAAPATAPGGRGAGGAGGAGGGGAGRGAGAAPAAAATPAPVEMAPGVFVLDGAYQAVAVAFNDYSIVIDGMQNEARTRAVIAQTKQLIPGKPIRYVVVTHSHFDHVSGLRDFVAEGTTILTHESSVRFFERALSTPRTINKAEAKPVGTPKVTGVGEKYVLQDGKQTVELYRIQGHVHADDMLIAYIPSAKTIVESDLVQPWISPQFTNVGYLSHLAKELDRLKLNYESFVSIHRPTPPPTVSRADFLKAAGN